LHLLNPLYRLKVGRETFTFALLMKFQAEIDKRKTFGIISHPDAGKTTLTEKLLLFGGAIQTAGAVKSNKIKKSATSDFMEIEKQRGISVATSVMSFEYRNKIVNILDTPGHKDFAEDTYRTLTAVDSVILVIDCVKGVEAQTERLMEVCRMRNTPVIVFINKMDRDGKNPFDLLEEIEQKLDIQTQPLTWPINMGSDFKGVYNLFNKSIIAFGKNQKATENDLVPMPDLSVPELDTMIGESNANQLREDGELLMGVYEEFDKASYLGGQLAPVFFGSAVNNFGIKDMLDTFVEIAPNPKPRMTDVREVLPGEDKFSGFVFKIHANIDPKHRDRLAFLRVCSGRFERNKFYKNIRADKKLRFNNPYTFLASDKEIVDNAYPGDVVGLYDSGTFKIGDTLTEGEEMNFIGIPSFSPELFKELINNDPMKSKQLDKGIRQLTDEGVAQMFTQHGGNRKIVGCVGELQFEVIQYRLLGEYGAKCSFQHMPYFKACWIKGDEQKVNDFIKFKGSNIVEDKEGNLVYLAESEWYLNTERQNNPDIDFYITSDFKHKL